MSSGQALSSTLLQVLWLFSLCSLKGNVASDRNSLISPYLPPNCMEVAERVSLTFFNIRLLVLMTCSHSLQILCYQDKHPCHVQDTCPLQRPAGFTSASELSVPIPVHCCLLSYVSEGTLKQKEIKYLLQGHIANV